jgi:hypothetical protein
VQARQKVATLLVSLPFLLARATEGTADEIAEHTSQSFSVGTDEGLATIPPAFDGNFRVAMPGNVSGPIFVRNLPAGTSQSLGMAVALIPPGGATPLPGDGLGYIFAAPDGDGDLVVYASSEGQVVSSAYSDEEGKWQIWLLHNGVDHVPYFEFHASGDLQPFTGFMTAPAGMNLALGANGLPAIEIDTELDVRFNGYGEGILYSDPWGNIRVLPNGSAGQVLVSNGPGAPPTWQDAERALRGSPPPRATPPRTSWPTR